MVFGRKSNARASFEREALSHLDALYGTAMRMTASSTEAEDLVQDTFLRAIRFHRRFQPGTNLKAWLFRMMLNLFINRYRRAKRGREIQEGALRQDLLERTLPAQQLAAARRPQEYFFERLFSDDVVRAIEELPPDFKLVVLLADVNDFSYAQIADILDIPVGTVMSRLHRGRRLLRATLYSYAVAEGYIKPQEQDPPAPADLNRYRESKSSAKDC